jgi:ATP-binding cassette subfamily F protein uup
MRVSEAVAGRGETVALGERTLRIESYLDRFGLAVTQQRSLVRHLSGGEKSRLQLARLIARGGNVLVLDEPTNDLDLATLRMLEEALLAFEGAALLVSHDRWFLDRVATKILYLDGHGGARLHHGDMSALLEELARERNARRSAEPVQRPAATSAPRPPQKPKRISPWQQKELDQLENRIPAVEAELAALDLQLSDPKLYSGPGQRVTEVRSLRATRAAELQSLYVRWEELESLR